MCAFEFVDNSSRGIGLFDGQRFRITTRGHERQHHHVSVGIEENVFDEIVGAKTAHVVPAHVVELRTFLLAGDGNVGRDVMTLDIENELLFAEVRLGELQIMICLGIDVEIAKTLAGGSIGLIDGK